MIISASRRTDIPCFYSEWFMKRIEAGSVVTRNPMNHGQISRVNLSPEVVDCIVFWTKDPFNMIDKLETLDHLGYKYYFQFTLTPYDHSIEKGLRDKDDIINTLISLSKIIGKERLLWRYDPIILNDILTIDYHKEQFARMCSKLGNYTESVTISFVDLYAKLKTRLLREIHTDEIAELSTFISSYAKDYGLTVKACSENFDLSGYGIAKASCIDKEAVSRIGGIPLDIKADKNQRQGCGCCESIDIGAYNTCRNGCIYCYANYSEASVKSNCSKHDVDNEILVGEVGADEKIKDRKIQSNKIGQLKFF